MTEETCRRHYSWREVIEDEWLVPMADPKVWEYPFDYIFQTVEDAVVGLEDFNAEYDPETWILVEVLLTKVEIEVT